VPDDAPCCDYEHVHSGADFATPWCFENDLFDPNQPGCCGLLTVRDLALKKNLNPQNYVPYVADWERHVLVNVVYQQPIELRQTVVLIENMIDTAASRVYIMDHLQRRYRSIGVLMNVES